MCRNTDNSRLGKAVIRSGCVGTQTFSFLLLEIKKERERRQRFFGRSVPNVVTTPTKLSILPVTEKNSK
jgi:hypothetical protein